MNNNYFDQVAQSETVEINDLFSDAFQYFQNKENGVLHIQEFRFLLNKLFTDFEEEEDADDQLREMFNFFDVNKDNELDIYEFHRMWDTFVVPVLKPTCALIVIDVQNDFIDGSLALRNCPAGQEGSDVVPVINKIIDTIPFHWVFYSYDWHPEDHVSFVDNVHLRKLHNSSSVHQPSEAKVLDTVVFEGSPPIEQKLWPRHCVQKSWGSQLHPDLKIANDAVFIYKGVSSDIDSYSAFWDNQKRSKTNLSDELKSRGITDAFICGLAYDYCVGFTALDALDHGFRTILIEDACRGVANDDINCMKKKLISKHAAVVTSDFVSKLVNGLNRQWQLGYFTFMLIRNQK